MPAKAARLDGFYSRWTAYGNEQLLEKGRKYASNPQLMDSALVCYTIIANRYYDGIKSEKDAEITVRAMNNLAILYYDYVYDYSKAFEYLNDALDIAHKYSLDELYVRVNLNLNNLYATSNILRNNLNGDREVIKLFKKSYATAKKASDWQAMTMIVCDMCDYAMSYDFTQDIIGEVKDYMSLAIPRDAMLREYSLTLCRGFLAFNKKEYVQAYRHFAQLESLSGGMRKPYAALLSAYTIRATTAFHLKNYDECEKLLLETVDEAKAVNNKPTLAVAYDRLNRLNLLRGNKANADKYRILYLETKEALLDNGNLERMNDTRFVNQLNKANEEVRRLHEKRQQQLRMIAVLSTGTGIVLMLLILLLVMYRRLKKNHLSLYLRSKEILRQDEQLRAERHDMEMNIHRMQQENESKHNDDKAYTDEAQEKQQTERQQRRKERTADNESLAGIYKKVLTIMDSTDELYNSDFTIQRLADLACERYWSVSQAINEMYGDNFKALLNSYRIKEACRRLDHSTAYENYTIGGIAESLGFKSRSNFVATFKKNVGMTPSEYHNIAIKK